MSTIMFDRLAERVIVPCFGVMAHGIEESWNGHTYSMRESTIFFSVG